MPSLSECISSSLFSSQTSKPNNYVSYLCYDYEMLTKNIHACLLTENYYAVIKIISSIIN